MKFKHYLTELYNIEAGQADEKHEIPVGENSSSISNPKIRAEMNYRLMNELGNYHLSPQSGIQAIRKVLHRYGFDLPALYDADPEGDEFVLDINQFGQENLTTNLYVLYYLTDEGHYEFYAEVGDDARMEELLSDEEEDEEEN